jgi:uncharacterized protein (DUF2147 family)
MINKWKSLFILAFTAIFISNAAFAKSPAGTWTTIDDTTGKKRAVVEVSVQNGVLHGTIIEVFKQAGDTGLCHNCPGAFKGKPVKGLQFLWGLKEDSDGEWSGGHILDPKTGKIYKAKLSLEGDKLLVRGYVGISLLGRTQTWIKK